MKAELDCMNQLDIIIIQQEPISWVNFMVTVQKYDKLQICTDPINVNKVIMREHYPTSMVEEFTAEIKSTNNFNKHDELLVH